MNRLRTLSPNRRLVPKVALPVAVVTALAAGYSDRQEADKPERNPTAEELLADKNRAIEALGVFPTEEEGLDGAHRYCADIGGVVLRFTEDDTTVVCDLPGVTIEIPTADSDPENDQPMLAACAAVSGTILGVSASEDDPYSYPACVVED